jgi:hypothetical protein
MDLSSIAHDSRQDLDHPVRVAVDAMGGDHAPEEIVRGSIRTSTSCLSAMVGGSSRSSARPRCRPT